MKIFFVQFFCLPHVRGRGCWREEIPSVRGQRQRQEEIPHAPKPKARGRGREELPHVQGAVAVRAQEGLEELFTFKVRRGSGEKIPLIQGKEQQLRFAGAAVKRYPTSKVRKNPCRMVGAERGYQKADRLKT